jgi:Sulfotransferase family
MGADRFFFIHLVKTAGTSFRKRLEHHFGETAIYPDASDVDRSEYFSIERVRERMRARGDEIRVVTGHFPLCTAEILGGGFTTLTIVREPVERILSHLHHHRAWTPSDRDKSLEEIYSDPQVFHGLVHNHMVKMLSLTPDEAQRAKELQLAGMLTRVEFTQERLERAKAGLASVDAVGLHERIDEFFEELAARFGWDLGPPQHQMRVDPLAKRGLVAEVSDSFRARITEDNAMDVELYRFAQHLRDRRQADAARGRIAG